MSNSTFATPIKEISIIPKYAVITNDDAQKTIAIFEESGRAVDYAVELNKESTGSYLFDPAAAPYKVTFLNEHTASIEQSIAGRPRVWVRVL